MGMVVEAPMTKSRHQQRERSDVPGEPLRRSWPTVNKARMVAGLAAAAIIPCLAFWLLLAVTSKNIELDLLILASAQVGGLAMCWFIGPGSLFLVWLGRTYSAISRFNCFALCATLAFFLPAFELLVSTAESPPTEAGEGLKRILGTVVIGLILTPLNLFGGWMLWRIAIRPAARPLLEIAEVF